MQHVLQNMTNLIQYTTIMTIWDSISGYEHYKRWQEGHQILKCLTLL